MEIFHIGAIPIPVDAVEKHQIISENQDFAEQRPTELKVVITNQSQSELGEGQGEQLVDDYGDFFEIASMASPGDRVKIIDNKDGNN